MPHSVGQYSKKRAEEEEEEEKQKPLFALSQQ